MQLVDQHWAIDYPVGDVATQVATPFYADAAHAGDGVCAHAFTVKRLSSQGYSMEQIQKPDDEVYGMVPNLACKQHSHELAQLAARSASAM